MSKQDLTDSFEIIEDSQTSRAHFLQSKGRSMR